MCQTPQSPHDKSMIPTGIVTFYTTIGITFVRVHPSSSFSSSSSSSSQPEMDQQHMAQQTEQSSAYNRCVPQHLIHDHRVAMIDPDVPVDISTLHLTTEQELSGKRMWSGEVGGTSVTGGPDTTVSNVLSKGTRNNNNHNHNNKNISFSNNSEDGQSSSDSSCSSLLSNNGRDHHRLVRAKMLQLIRKTLQNSSTGRGLERESSVPFAVVLERHLYRSASTFEIYSDRSTLKTRLRRITEALVSRRCKKKQEQKKHATRATRSTVLRQTLGGMRYEYVLGLVQQIKQLRLSRVCHSCTQASTSCPLPSSERPAAIPEQQAIPPAVRALYFEAALVNHFDSAPLSLIPKLPWESFVSQAEKIVRIYRDWNTSNNSV